MAEDIPDVIVEVVPAEGIGIITAEAVAVDLDILRIKEAEDINEKVLGVAAKKASSSLIIWEELAFF
ncbi:hypothetical protein [Virgibacillus necropolis]|uniref:Uncharacterized protein n=1 Tax=Virgibacillus necropolis TaxID=163877 RepID=A0A221M7I2_9BACI|nr:hypothetical protein [Virgibacillus necropolis]ASN03584.1 hypothetical protein CFK40_00360 [Virgibacillus necropolis]